MAFYKNLTGETTKIGLIAKQAPNDPLSFIYAVSGDTNVLGVITQSVPKYAQCEIQSTGVAKVLLSDSTVQGSTIRLYKAGDNASRATSKTAKRSDTPYLKIGTALQSGRGLVNVALNLAAISTTSTAIAEYADNAAAIAGGLVAGDFYRTGDSLMVVH